MTDRQRQRYRVRDRQTERRARQRGHRNTEGDTDERHQRETERDRERGGVGEGENTERTDRGDRLLQLLSSAISDGRQHLSTCNVSITQSLLVLQLTTYQSSLPCFASVATGIHLYPS